MRLEQKVAVSPTKFYTNLLQAFKREYAYHTGQDENMLTNAEITSGLQYEVRNEAGSYRVKLQELIPNEFYESIIYSNRGQTHIVYEIRLGENQESSYITYSETTENGNIFQKINEKILSFFFKKKLMQGMQQKIEQIAQL